MNFVFCLFIALAVLPGVAQDTLQADLAGNPVELTLVKADDLSPADFPKESTELRVVSATLTDDTNTYLLLQDNGIAPDSQAFAAVYDLNPSIPDVNKVKAHSTILLPSVVSGPLLQTKLRNGFLVELALYPQLRRSLNERIKDLQTLAPSADQLTEDATARSQLRDLFEWFNQIEERYDRRTDPPLRRDTLVAMNEEAGVLLSMLQEARQGHHPLSPAQLTQLIAIHSDLQDDISQYGQVLADAAPHAQTAYKVTVNIAGADASLIKILRVYYTYNGLFVPLPATPPIPSYPFDQLGATATKTLVMKNYQVWAARDGDANHPLTPAHLLIIDSVSPTELTVDLSIQKVLKP